MKELVLRSLSCWLLLLLGIIAATNSVIYPDSIVVRTLKPSDFNKTHTGWVWELDAESKNIERLSTSSALSSIAFLGDRLIPNRTTYTTWPESDRPWHRVMDNSLLLSLDPAQESLLETKPLQIAFLGEYSRVRAWSAVASICLFVFWCYQFPKQFNDALRHLLRSSFWIAGILIGLTIVVQFGFWSEVLSPVPLQETQLISGEPIKWYTHAVWGLRRLESSGPGLVVVMALMIAIAYRRQNHLADVFEHRATLIRHSWAIALAACGLTSLVSIWFGAGMRYAPDLTHYSSPLQSQLIWSDASEYMAGAKKLLSDGSLTAFNQRRPLNASLLTVRYSLSFGDRRLCQWIEYGLFAASLGLLIRNVTLWLGTASGLATLGWVWGFSRWYSATFLSETLGLSLGCWGVSVLLLADIRASHGAKAWSSQGNHFATLLISVAIMTVSQLARPGALFSVPLLGLAATLYLSTRTDLHQALLGRTVRFFGYLGAFSAVAILGVVFQSAINMTYGDGASRQGANLSYTIVGMTEGKSWSEVMVAHKPELHSLKSENEIANYLYSLAWSNLRNQPHVFVRQLMKGCWSFARELPGTLSRTAFPELGRLNCTKGFTVIVCFGALAYWWFHRSSLLALYVFFLMVGLVASVAIVFLDGSWRVLAASWPLLAVGASGCFAATGQGVENGELGTEKSIGKSIGFHGLLLLVLVAAAWAGPTLARQVWRAERQSDASAAIEKPRVGDEFAPISIEPFCEPAIRVNGPSPSMTKRSFLAMLQQSDLETLPQLCNVLETEQPFSIRLCFDPRYGCLWWIIKFEADVHPPNSTGEKRWEFALAPNIVIERQD